MKMLFRKVILALYTAGVFFSRMALPLVKRFP